MDQQARWDAEAATFDDEPDHGLTDPDTRAAWRALLLGVLPPAPARIADLGCGTGTLSWLLVDEGYAVDGLDFSLEMIRLAKAKAATATGETARFLVGDASAPHLERSTYNVVLSRHVLWALPNPVMAVDRWVDLLAPGGTLVLVEGSWSTGAGLTADECERIVRTRRQHVEVTRLTDPLLWGKRVTDERYILVSRD